MSGDNFSFNNVSPSITEGVVEESLFFPAQQQTQLIELISHLCRYSSLLLTVTGAQGCGKSLIRRKVVDSMDSGVVLCELTTTGIIQPQAFLQILCETLAVNPGGADLSHYLVSLKNYFSQLHDEGQICLIVVDDAHLLSNETLELMVLLLSDDDDQKRPHILLLGEPPLIEALLGSRLKERFMAIGHHLSVQPFTTEESWGYLDYRLNAAGLSNQLGDTFKADVIRAGGGIPGQINNMANLALSDPEGLKRVAGITTSKAAKKTAKAKTKTAPEPTVGMAAAQDDAPRSKTARLKSPQLPIWHIAALALVASLLGVAYLYQDEITGATPEPAVSENTPLTDLNRLARPTEETLAEVEEATATDREAVTIIKPVYPDQETESASEAEVRSEADKREADAQLLAGTPSPNTLSPTTPAAQPTVSVARSVAPVSPPITQAAPPPAVSATTPPAPPKPATVKPAASDKISSPYKQEKELLALDSKLYTLQLLGSHIEENAVRFIDGLKSKDSAHYFETVYKNKPWFVVIYGQYKDRDTAIASIPTLPDELQARKPWARSIASVQADILKK